MSSTVEERYGFGMDDVEADVYDALLAARTLCKHLYETDDLSQYRMEVIEVSRLLLEQREKIST